jgi:uncharacterized glyoxalase superfamily protein PhnB
MTDVIPMLSYEDGVVALEWLCRAFGFVEVERMVDATGRLAHGELQVGQGRVMLASPTPAYESPAHQRVHCAAAAAWSQVPYVINGVLVYVSDVAAHFEVAKRAGATILTEIEHGFPGTRYRAADLEGQRWMFMQRE